MNLKHWILGHMPGRIGRRFRERTWQWMERPYGAILTRIIEEGDKPVRVTFSDGSKASAYWLGDR